MDACIRDLGFQRFDSIFESNLVRIRFFYRSHVASYMT